MQPIPIGLGAFIAANPDVSRFGAPTAALDAAASRKVAYGVGSSRNIKDQRRRARCLGYSLSTFLLLRLLDSIESLRREFNPSVNAFEDLRRLLGPAYEKSAAWPSSCLLTSA